MGRGKCPVAWGRGFRFSCAVFPYQVSWWWLEKDDPAGIGDTEEDLKGQQEQKKKMPPAATPTIRGSSCSRHFLCSRCSPYALHVNSCLWLISCQSLSSYLIGIYGTRISETSSLCHWTPIHPPLPVHLKTSYMLLYLQVPFYRKTTSRSSPGIPWCEPPPLQKRHPSRLQL